MGKVLIRTLLAGLLIHSVSAAFGDEGQAAKPSQPARKTRVKLGPVTVGGFYSHLSGPGYYGYPYYSRYSYPYAPFYHPGFFPGFGPAADKGEVKLQAEPKTAEVFLDGAYAGVAGDLKSMWLDPGAYNLTVKAEQRAPFAQRIYVLTGKTLRITAHPGPEKAEAKP